MWHCSIIQNIPIKKNLVSLRLRTLPALEGKFEAKQKQRLISRKSQSLLMLLFCKLKEQKWWFSSALHWIAFELLNLVKCPKTDENFTTALSPIWRTYGIRSVSIFLSIKEHMASAPSGKTIHLNKICRSRASTYWVKSNYGNVKTPLLTIHHMFCRKSHHRCLTRS